MLWYARCETASRLNSCVLEGAKTYGLSPSERKAEIARLKREAARSMIVPDGGEIELTPIGALPWHLENLIIDDTESSKAT